MTLDFDLTKKVGTQLDTWLADRRLKTLPIGRNTWLGGAEGKIYIRFCRGLNRIDLSSFEISEKFQRRGVARSIIELACSKSDLTVRVENIVNLGWGKRLVNFQVDGRRTVVTRDCIGTPTVDFVKE